MVFIRGENRGRNSIEYFQSGISSNLLMDSTQRSIHHNSKSDKKSPKKIRHPSLAVPSNLETNQAINLVTELPANDDSHIPSLKLDSPVEHRTPKLEAPSSKEAIALNYLRYLEEDNSDLLMNNKYKEDIFQENDFNNSFRLSPFMGPIRKSVHKKSLEGVQEDQRSTLIKVNKTIQMKRGVTSQVKSRHHRLRTDPNEEYSKLQRSKDLTLNDENTKRTSTRNGTAGAQMVVNQVKMIFPAHLAKSEEPRPATRVMHELKGNKSIKSIKDIKVLFTENSNNAVMAQLGYRKALNIRARQTYKKANNVSKGPENIQLVGRSYSVPKFAQRQSIQSAIRTPDLQRGSMDLRKDSQLQLPMQQLPILTAPPEEPAEPFVKYITEEKVKLGEHYGNGSKIYLQTLLKEGERHSLKKKYLHLKDSVSSVEEGISSVALEGWDKSNSKDIIELKPKKTVEAKKVNEIQVGFWFKAKKNLINPLYRVEDGKNETNDENKVAVKDLLGENVLKIGKVPGSYQLKSIKSIGTSPKKEENTGTMSNMSPILLNNKSSNMANPRSRLMSRQSYSFKDPIHQGDFITNHNFSRTSTKGFKINIPPTHGHKKSFSGGGEANLSAREETRKPLDLLKYPLRGSMNIAKTAR